MKTKHDFAPKAAPAQAAAAFEAPKATEPAAPPAPTIAPTVKAGKSKWRVALNCPTPLAHPELTVEADNESEARAKFCRANGIDDSVHQWTVEPVE